MARVKKEDLEQIIESNGINFIKLIFTDLNGDLKSVELDIDQLERVLEGEAMFDGSSITGFTRIEESDMYLVPDLNSAYTELNTITFFCDTHTTDKKPYEGDSRNILKRTLKKAKEMGYEVMVGPEPEFFLFNKDGSPVDESGYFSSTEELSSNIRKKVSKRLKNNYGFTIEALHHEVAIGQQEIDFKYDHALQTADNIQIFKHVTKSVAAEHGLIASFMPKPIEGVNGSGMHCNISLFKDNENAFATEDRGLSSEAQYFIGGVLKHARELAALTNPTVNSYKRIVPGYEAPVYVAWSGKNRSCMIRIPASRGSSTRVEVRNPDPSANPYLALAALIEAGLSGIQHKLNAPKEENKNLFSLDLTVLNSIGIETLPKNLSEAVSVLRDSELARGFMGEELFDTYIKTKEAEWDDYRTSVSDWEKRKYLNI